MNVLMITPYLAPEFGGPARTVPALSSALAALGVQVNLLSLDFGGQAGAPLLPSAQNVQTSLVPAYYSPQCRLIWAPQFRRALLKLAQQQKMAVIHDNGLWLPVHHAAARAAHRLKIPRVISPRGTISQVALSQKAWKKRLAWALYQRRDLLAAKGLHATSHDEAQHLRRLGCRQPIAVIPNGVTLPPESNSEAAKRKDRTVLFIGRIHPLKGLLNLVEAWARVRPAGWRAILAGPDEEGHAAELQASIQANALQDVFSLPGLVEGKAKWDLFRGADLFVSPSYTENFGLSIAEALAAGVPAITTRGAPWPELQSHRCGWWVETGIEPLAAALREATALTDGQRQEMGGRGRALVESRYSWPSLATQMRSFYGWMLGQETKPDSVLLN